MNSSCCDKNGMCDELNLCEVIHSIALEETALSHILNAEGEKIQKAVAIKDASICDLLSVNESVIATIKEITSLEIILMGKLEAVIKQFNTQVSCDCSCCGNPPCIVENCKNKKIKIRGTVTNQCGKSVASIVCVQSINNFEMCTDNYGNFEINCFEVRDKFCIYAFVPNSCLKSEIISESCITKNLYNIKLTVKQC